MVTMDRCILIGIKVETIKFLVNKVAKLATFYKIGEKIYFQDYRCQNTSLEQNESMSPHLAKNFDLSY